MSGETTTTHPTLTPIMTPPLNWADLPTDVLRCVADRLQHNPTSYLAARAVCKAWHSAMPPFIIVADAVPMAAASSRPFRLMALPTGSKCVRANHDWVAIAYRKHGCFYRKPVYRFNRNRRARTEVKPPTHEAEERRYYYRNFQGEQILMDRTGMPEWQNPGGRKSFMALVNSVTGRLIELPEHDKLEPWTVTKVVFAPNPRTNDYTVVVSVGWRCLAYISTRDDGAWSFGKIPEGAQYGSVIVADMVYSESGGGDDSVYCLARSGDVYVLRVPRGCPTKPVIDPLVPELTGSHFNPASVFQAPHYTLCTMLTSAKYLVFCNGHLHQVWRNTIGSPFDRRLPGGGFLPVRKDEAFVFRYDPSCRPCWKGVGDLGGGLAVFVGPAISAALVRAEGVRGLKGDCVYWVGEPGNINTVVFDMRTKTSTTPCLSWSAGCGRSICWCSMGGDAGSSNYEDGEILQGRQKRQRVVV
jgi:hypothetical protein